LWWSQSGDHPENNLVEFGDILDMKVEKKKQNPLKLLTTSWYLPSKSGNLEKNSLKSGEFGSFVFHEKSFVWVEIWFKFSIK
jgi:hypothetical protein